MTAFTTPENKSTGFRLSLVMQQSQETTLGSKHFHLPPLMFTLNISLGSNILANKMQPTFDFLTQSIAIWVSDKSYWPLAQPVSRLLSRELWDVLLLVLGLMFLQDGILQSVWPFNYLAWLLFCNRLVNFDPVPHLHNFSPSPRARHIVQQQWSFNAYRSTAKPQSIIDFNWMGNLHLNAPTRFIYGVQCSSTLSSGWKSVACTAVSPTALPFGITQLSHSADHQGKAPRSTAPNQWETKVA